MRVFTFAATSEEAPARAIARIYLGKVGKQHDWHPVLFNGPTEEDVRRQAEEWWERETTKADKRKGPRKAMAAAEDIGDVL